MLNIWCSMCKFPVKHFVRFFPVLYLIFSGISCKDNSTVEPHPYTPGSNLMAVLSAAPDTLPIGGGKVTLLWTSRNASAASLAPGVGTVALTGATTLDVRKTTMFVLIVSNGVRFFSDTITVVVLTPGGLNCTFTASPDSLPFGGGMVKLTWTSVADSTASISPGIGTVPLSGDTTVHVNSTTQFILTISGNGYTLSDTVPVKVNPTWEFSYPLARGTTWTYDYHYYYSASTTNRLIHGVHVWSVESRDSLYGRVTCQIADKEYDTLLSSSNPTVQTSSKSFTIVVTQDSIFANWINLTHMTVSLSDGISHLPRFVSTPTDTITLGIVPQAEYATGAGLIRYMNAFAGSQAFVTESMTLVSMSSASEDNSVAVHR